jgi:hypothetical protein
MSVDEAVAFALSLDDPRRASQEIQEYADG